MYRLSAIVTVCFLVVLFAALNWSELTHSSPLDLLFRYVEAPLGIVMLAIFLVLLLIYGCLEVAALIESRKNAGELEEARKVALSKEESRIYALEKRLAEELKEIDRKLKEILRQSKNGRSPVLHEDF
jgi:uncharacterized integral membrane protein